MSRSAISFLITTTFTSLGLVACTPSQTPAPKAPAQAGAPESTTASADPATSQSGAAGEPASPPARAQATWEWTLTPDTSNVPADGVYAFVGDGTIHKLEVARITARKDGWDIDLRASEDSMSIGPSLTVKQALKPGTKAMGSKPNIAYFQVPSASTSATGGSATTSLNAEHNFAVEITKFDITHKYDAKDMNVRFGEAGTASGKIAVAFRGEKGKFWAAGTFSNATIKYSGEPPLLK